MSTRGNRIAWMTALGAGLVASFAALPQARAELVYETDAPAVQQDRETMRQALQASEKAQVTVQQVQAQPQQPVAAPAAPAAAAPAPVAVVPAVPAASPATSNDSGVEVQNLSKAELMRRERVREELKNEDVLQERLEELRLRDEKRRTQQLIQAEALPDGSADSAQPASVAAAPAAPATAAVTAVKDQVIQAPATEGPAAQTVSAPLPDAGVSASASNDSQGSGLLGSEKMSLSFSPQGGIGNFVGGTPVQIMPRFLAGAGIGIEFGDIVGIEASYTYGQYGLSALTAFGQQYSYINPYAYNNGSTYLLNQNVFALGAKVHVLGSQSRFRPFIGAGGAYARSFMNYDPNVIASVNQYAPYYGYQSMTGPDYNLSQFLGYVSAGLDVKLTKNISLGAQVRYYAVLSANENQPLNNLALLGPSMMNYGLMPSGLQGYGANIDKAAVVASMAQSGSYAVLGGLTFNF